MEQLKIAANPDSDESDLLGYEQNLGTALVKLKIASLQAVESGHMGAMDKVGAIVGLLRDICARRRSPEADEVFWDQLSKCYPINSGWATSHAHLSAALQLRLLHQMVAQDPSPHTAVKAQLDRISDSAFMEGFTIALKLMAPFNIRFNPEFYDVLFILKRRLSKPEFMPGAVEQIAANQDLYFDFFRKVLKVASMPWVIKPEGDESIQSLNNRRKHLVLSLMGYSDDESDVMVESGDADHLIPTASEFNRMKKALSFPAEFLCLLYHATESPLVREIAEVAVDDPTGRMPYRFFEQMGVVRSNEWFHTAQDKSGLGKAVVLYEHAIHTPGIELSVARVAMQPLTSSEPGLLERLVSILTHVPIKDSECRRKGQILFDALVANMSSGKSSEKLREALEAGTIHPVFYAKHKGLKGRRLECDMGL
jgi:hypothetical protein